MASSKFLQENSMVHVCAAAGGTRARMGMHVHTADVE
jgi:hypothetical protein